MREIFTPAPEDSARFVKAPEVDKLFHLVGKARIEVIAAGKEVEELMLPRLRPVEVVLAAGFDDEGHQLGNLSLEIKNEYHLFQMLLFPIYILNTLEWVLGSLKKKTE